MTGKQFSSAIAPWGFHTQADLADWLGVSRRTAQNYIYDGPPEPVAKLIRLMVRLNLGPDDVP